MSEDEQHNGKEGLLTRTVREFPDVFRGSVNANSMKASRWWKDRDTLANPDQVEPLSVNSRQHSINRKVLLKARKGRGPKTQAWVTWLYGELEDEFDRLRKAGVKFSAKLLKYLAVDLLETSQHSEFCATFSPSGVAISQKINDRWIRRFMDNRNIVGRAQKGKLMVSAERQQHIDKEIAFHLGVVLRDFKSGVLDEDVVENVDETHFVINMDNGKTLGFRGDENVKYADVVSGGIGMTMVVRITGGPLARIEVPMIIFQNDNCSYPIRGLEDAVPGVAYRTARKGFMTSVVWKQWLSEPIVQSTRNQGNRTRVIWCDNYGGHKDDSAVQDCLTRLNASVRKLPPCSTDKVQPCDSFVISKVKDAWTDGWEKYKLEVIKSGSGFQNSGRRNGRSSGALKNPGKKFFLELAAAAVQHVNDQRDTNGLTFARKAMIRCGLSLDVNGVWHEKQLSPELQEIINTHRVYFEGKSVPAWNAVDQSEVEDTQDSA